MTDIIRLESFTIDAIVGITDPEQRALQPVVIDLVMSVDLAGAAGGDLSRSVDYAAVYEQTKTLVQYGHWRLIESLAVGIANLVLAPPAASERRAQVDAIEVTIRKPNILPGATPSVTVRRTSDGIDLQTRLSPPKTWVDTLVRTDFAAAYRIHVETGSSWEAPPGAAVHVIAGSVLADGRPIGAGTRLARGQARRISATGEAAATLLVVAIPALKD